MIDTRTDLTQLRASAEAARARAQELRAASLAIQQRLLVTRRELAEVSEHTQATLKAVRQHLDSLRTGSAEQSRSDIQPANALLKALAVFERDESHLEELADDLIAAHQTATALGHDDLRAQLGSALMQIGRHLATKIGPRAAGVIMN